MIVATDTKSRILDVAEQLFAEQGFAQTSLRDITSEASANLASVNYHFGSKLALLKAVFERRVGPVNADRMERLTALERESTTTAPELEAVLRAFFTPPFEHFFRTGGLGSRHFMKLAGSAHSDPNPEIRETFLALFSEVFERFLKLLARAVPELAPAELERRAHFSLGAMAFTLSGCQNPNLKRVKPDEWVQSLVDYAAAGLRSVSSKKG